jgi:hypothetical protein
MPQRRHTRLGQERERKMGKDDETDKDKDRGRPGKHDPEREGHVHEDTAKRIDPRKYEPPPDDDE